LTAGGRHATITVVTERVQAGRDSEQTDPTTAPASGVPVAPVARRRDNVQRIHLHLREEILDGRLPPGEELSQVQLATALGVSRGPLREALRLLEREGLVEAEPNRRVVVSPLSWADVEQLYALRIVTDSLALRGGVPRFTQDDLDRLGDTLLELDELSTDSDVEAWEIPHRRFHQLLTSYGGDRLARMSAQLSDHAERYRRAYLGNEPTAWSTSSREHHAILEACKDRDTSSAVEHLARHLSRTVLTVLASNAPAHDPMLVREALLAATQSPVSQRSKQYAVDGVQ
jgi:DNA-binding GntR family transcriptional regulator